MNGLTPRSFAILAGALLLRVPVVAGPELLDVPLPPAGDTDPLVDAAIGTVASEIRFLEADPETPHAELAEAYGELGRLLHAHSLFEGAEAAYEDALRLVPDDYRWHYYLARVASRTGDLRRSVEHFRGALALEPGLAPARRGLAETLLELHELAPAEAEFGELAKDPAAEAAGRVGLGLVALEHRDYQRAARELQRALRLQPTADRTHYPLAMAYRGLGDLERAHEHFERAGNRPVRLPDPLMESVHAGAAGQQAAMRPALRALDAGRVEDGVRLLRRFVERFPESPRGHINLGVALNRSGEAETALEHYLRAVELDPDAPLGLLQLGAQLSSMGRLDEAEIQLRRGAELDPQDPQVLAALGRVLVVSGRPGEALPPLQDALRLDPASEPAAWGLVEALIALGRFGEALIQAEEARDRHHESERIAHQLARLLASVPDASRRDGPRAYRLALESVRTNLTTSRLVTLALALGEVGRCEEAAAWQREVVGAYERQSADGIELQRERLERYASGPPCRPPFEAAPASPGDRG